MKISFYYAQNPEIKWRNWTILNVGLGGVYVSIYNLAKEFQKMGHEVTIWGHILKQDIYEGINFIDVSHYTSDYKEDLLIGVETFPQVTKAKKVVTWAYRNTPKSANLINETIFRSEIHATILKELIKDKTYIIPDGVDLDLFKPEKKRQKDVTCISHPIKTFKHFREITPRLKEIDKNINVHLWGNAEIWGWNNDEFINLQNDLIMSGNLYHGREGQTKITKELNKSKVFLYPSNFEEPFGLSVLEAMASGCVPIVSKVGNLPNLVKDCGYIIDGKPDDFGWITKAIEKTLKILNNENLFTERSKLCRKKAEQYGWTEVAQKWSDQILKK